MAPFFMSYVGLCLFYSSSIEPRRQSLYYLYVGQKQGECLGNYFMGFSVLGGIQSGAVGGWPGLAWLWAYGIRYSRS